MQVFSCEVCQLSNNTYFVEDLSTAGSETSVRVWLLLQSSSFRRAPPKQKKSLQKNCYYYNRYNYNVTKEKDQMIFLRMVSFCNTGG